MKLKRFIVLGWLTGSLLCGFCKVKAQDVVPCLIFTGNSDTENRIDLSKLNRITFEDDGMIITSSKESDVKEVKLLYSLFYHLEIGEAVPTTSSGLNLIETDNVSRLRFHSDIKTIVIESTSGLPFSVGVFNLDGVLIATSNILAEQPLSVESLSSGAYIVLASDGESKLSLKFIIN